VLPDELPLEEEPDEPLEELEDEEPPVLANASPSAWVLKYFLVPSLFVAAYLPAFAPLDTLTTAILKIGHA
jgi:hypothetical protein